MHATRSARRGVVSLLVVGLLAVPTVTAAVPTCFPSSPPEPEMIGNQVSAKNRYLSIQAGDPGRIQAIRVTAVSLPPPFDMWNGQQWFVGEPVQPCEGAGQGITGPPPWCGARAPQSWFWAAPLVCDPSAAHWMDWTTLADYCNAPWDFDIDGTPCTDDSDCGSGTCGVEGLVHLYHEAIVPSHMATSTGPIDIPADYDIQVIDSTASLFNEDCYSARLTMTQAGWGDINTDVSTCPNGPPDGSVGVVTDIVAGLNKFVNRPCAVRKTRANLAYSQVRLKVDIIDVIMPLDAFTGADYPYGAGNCYCIDPECSAKQCSGGPDHGSLCTDDSDCSSSPCSLDAVR